MKQTSISAISFHQVSEKTSKSTFHQQMSTRHSRYLEQHLTRAQKLKQLRSCAEPSGFQASKKQNELLHTMLAGRDSLVS